MSRVSIAAPHLSVEAVKEKIKSARSFWQRQKWLVVYNALVEPRYAAQVARHTGVSIGTVDKVISQYNRKGTEALSTPGKAGRRNQYLCWEQEKEFLASFKDKAKKGEIATTAEIKMAFEQLVEQTVHKTTIYHLLERHESRKIVPRQSHPQANLESQEAFKKTSRDKLRQF